jgi:hypothetical protein
MRMTSVTIFVGLCLAAIATPLCLAQGVPGATIDDEWGPKDRGLPGTWLLSIEFTGLPPFRFLMTVDPDGTVNGPLPDHSSRPVPDTRSSCVGPWKRIGAREFQMTMYCLSSQDMDGRFHLGRFNLTLSKDGKTISDPAFKWEWWWGHPSDGTYIGYGYGAVLGERLPNVPKD